MPCREHSWQGDVLTLARPVKLETLERLTGARFAVHGQQVDSKAAPPAEVPLISEHGALVVDKEMDTAHLHVAIADSPDMSRHTIAIRTLQASGGPRRTTQGPPLGAGGV